MIMPQVAGRLAECTSRFIGDHGNPFRTLSGHFIVQHFQTIEGEILMIIHLKTLCEMSPLCIANGFILMHFVVWEANVNAQSKAVRRCLLFGESFGWVAGNHCTSSTSLELK